MLIEFNNIETTSALLDDRDCLHNLHNDVNRKFVETHFDYDDWEIETDKGWSDISCVGKTVPYEVWEIETVSGKKLQCADNHIVFDDVFSEVFVKDLNKDTRPDKIWVQGDSGQLVCETVKSVKNLGYEENMYDIQVNDENHRYYTNGILSHNSIILCNDAADFIRKGKNVVFITCEMSEEKVMRRISANLFDITLEQYDELVKSQAKVKKKLNDLVSRSMFPLGRLFIKEYPTGQCTVLDLESYIKEVQEVYNFKIDILVVDYINIMCNYRNPNSENTYLKIKALAEDLRGLAVKYGFIVDTASQIGRNALNSSDINIEDISESMGLAHTCDSIIGIIQTEDMQIGEIDEETNVAVPYYWFKILKIREGQNKNKKFRVNINYNKMKLIEKTDEIDTLSHFK
jgi:KaiC/GvpD/RAD55 family RecA-like ATPase